LSVSYSSKIKKVPSASRSHGAVIRVYDNAGNVIETREHAGAFREPMSISREQALATFHQRLSSSSRIADLSSRNAVSFHPRVQRNAFRRHDAHQQSRSFARWNQSLRRSPNSNRLY
jgi:hypothetical protein